MTSDTFFQFVAYVGLPTILGLLGYLFRGIMQRIDNIEHKVNQCMTEEEVRQVMKDKLDPLSEDLKDIKDSLKSLYALLITKN